jgi:protein-S-isoprenylcysteine O-methyltransferase Ste14
VSRYLALIYGLVAYAISVATLLWLVGFVGNIFVAKSIDSGFEEPSGEALLTNLFWLALFAVQHTVMARSGFKNWWARIMPAPIERSTYVLVASLILLLLFRNWASMPGVVWEIDSPTGQRIVELLFWTGWLIALSSTFSIDHSDLFGLRQVRTYFRGEPYTPVKFKMPALYRCVRHPTMLGFLIAFWATPVMTAGHLLFAAAATGYIFVGISFEERDLAARFGEAYREYSRRIPMIFPLRRKK